MKIDRKFVRILKSGYYDNMDIDKDLGFLRDKTIKRCAECGKETEYSRCRECYFKSMDEAYL